MTHCVCTCWPHAQLIAAVWGCQLARNVKALNMAVAWNDTELMHARKYAIKFNLQ